MPIKTIQPTFKPMMLRSGGKDEMSPYAGLGILIFLLILFAPLLVLVWSVFNTIAAGNSEWLQLLLPTGRKWQLLWNSIKLAIGVATTGTLVGGLIASSLWQMRWATHLRWGLLVLFFLPPYIHALGWSDISLRVNNLLQNWGLQFGSLQGWLGCWWIELMAFLPIAIGLSLIGLTSVKVEMIEAARLISPDLRVFWRVILPLAAPSFWTSAGLLFLMSLTDYSIPSLFGVGAYSLEIFAEYSASNEPVRAFLVSIPLLIIASLVIGFAQSSLKQTMQQSWRRYSWGVAPSLPQWLKLLQGLAMGILVLQVAIPLISLVALTVAGQQWGATLASARGEILFTFGLASVTAITCLPLAIAIATELNRSDWRSFLGWWAITWAVALPAPLVGVGLIALWNHPLAIEVYGTALMPLYAHLTRFTPFASLVLLAQMRQIDPAIAEATRLVSGARWRVWLYIRLPLMIPSLIAASGIVFALSTGELGATLIVIPAGYSTLTLRIYNYLHYGSSSDVAVLGLVIVAIACLAGAMISLVLTGWAHLLKQEG